MVSPNFGHSPAPQRHLQEVERLARKFRLDDPVASRFTELIHRRKKDGEIDRMHKEGRGVAGNVLPKRPKRAGNKLVS